MAPGWILRAFTPRGRPPGPTDFEKRHLENTGVDFHHFWTKLGGSRALKYRACAVKQRNWNSHLQSSGSGGNGGSSFRPGPPPTRAGGQDDGSYQTPSNDLTQPVFIRIPLAVGVLTVLPSPQNLQKLLPQSRRGATGKGLSPSLAAMRNAPKSQKLNTN